MTVRFSQKKTKAELEAEVAVLTQELKALRQPAADSMADSVADSRQRMAETLHNLQVHQEELRAQNDELRKAQEDLQKVGTRYRDLFEYSPVGYFIIEDNYTVVDANIAGIGMLGRTKGHIAGKPFLLFVAKECRRQLGAHFLTVRETRRATTELWLSPDLGPSFPVILESVQLGDGWGNGWRCLTTAMDITDRKRAELALRGSETRFRAIFEQSPLAMQIVDYQSVPSMSNRAWVKLWGQPAPSGISIGSHPVLGKIGAEGHLAQGLAGQAVEIPAIHVATDEDRWIHGYVYPVRAEDDSVPEVVLVNEDITERKRMELALAERTELLRRHYENLRVLSEIAALPPSTASLRLSEALDRARRHLDLPMGSICRADSKSLTIEYYAASDEAGLECGTVYDLAATYCDLTMRQGDVVAIAHMARSAHADHPAYRDFGLETYIGAPLRVRDRLFGTISFSSTVPNPRPFDDGDTEFMRLLARWVGAVLEEDAVMRDLANSNAELEQFAYVASHDLRQPLRQVSSYVSLLERRYRDKLDAEALEFIAYAHEGAVRMDRLIVDLLEFSRVGRYAKLTSSVALDDVVEQAVANLRTNITEAGGQVNIQSDLPGLVGDESDLVRLFQNLIGNAIKYSLPGRPPVINITAETTAMSHAVTIQDNGIGIAPEYFDTIFGVFKRLHTPDKYEGTGIGLAICKKVIERHKGRIWVESEPGKGTAFHLEFPRGR